MYAPERGVEFLPHLLERQRQRGAPPDKHVIMAGTHLAGGRKPDNLP